MTQYRQDSIRLQSSNGSHKTSLLSYGGKCAAEFAQSCQQTSGRSSCMSGLVYFAPQLAQSDVNAVCSASAWCTLSLIGVTHVLRGLSRDAGMESSLV